MRKSRVTWMVALIASLVLAGCGGAASGSGGGAQAPGGIIQINGAGSTFQLPVESQWIAAYQKVDPSVTINYQGIGSGGGKSAILDGTVDFAGTDSLLTDAQYQQGGDLQMIPVLAGAVVPIYNIQGIGASDPPLVLDGPTLAAIYAATITKWNDPAISALNPDLASKLPDASITAVHRSDGSGTTEIVTDALSSFSQSWADNVGAGPSVEWPVDKAGSGIGGKGNQGVAAAVQNTPNSIGYVELSFAVSNKITFAKMKNAAGNVVTADADTLQSAMNDFAGGFSDKLTTTIVNGKGAQSWPVSGYTYVIIHMNSMKDCTKAAALLQYLQWAVTSPDAAKIAADLGYAGLPQSVQQQALAKLGEATCGGQPILKSSQ